MMADRSLAQVNEDKPLVVTRGESTSAELLRAVLVIAPLAYTGVLLYTHLTTAEVSSWRLGLWVGICTISSLISFYMPRQYLILYDTHVFSGLALRKWGFVLGHSVPYEGITSISLSKGIGPTTLLTIWSCSDEISIEIQCEARLKENLRLLRLKVDQSLLSEDVRRFLQSHHE